MHNEQIVLVERPMSGSIWDIELSLIRHGRKPIGVKVECLNLTRKFGKTECPMSGWATRRSPNLKRIPAA